MLDGGAAGVDYVEDGVVVEAAEFLVAVGFLLSVLAASEGGKEGLNGVEFLRSFEGREAVGGGAGDETVGGLGGGGVQGSQESGAICSGRMGPAGVHWPRSSKTGTVRQSRFGGIDGGGGSGSGFVGPGAGRGVGLGGCIRPPRGGPGVRTGGRSS